MILFLLLSSIYNQQNIPQSLVIQKPYPRPLEPEWQGGCNCKKIDGGEFSTEEVYTWNSGHEMVTGMGDRKISKTIYFDESFELPPKIQATLSQIDVDKNHNLRVTCKATQIDDEKFVLEIHTWWDTKLYRAQCDWIAYGY